MARVGQAVCREKRANFNVSVIFLSRNFYFMKANSITFRATYYDQCLLPLRLILSFLFLALLINKLLLLFFLYYVNSTILQYIPIIISPLDLFQHPQIFQEDHDVIQTLINLLSYSIFKKKISMNLL